MLFTNKEEKSSSVKFKEKIAKDISDWFIEQSTIIGTTACANIMIYEPSIPPEIIKHELERVPTTKI